MAEPRGKFTSELLAEAFNQLAVLPLPPGGYSAWSLEVLEALGALAAIPESVALAEAARAAHELKRAHLGVLARRQMLKAWAELTPATRSEKIAQMRAAAAILLAPVLAREELAAKLLVAQDAKLTQAAQWLREHAAEVPGEVGIAIRRFLIETLV